MLGLKIPLTSLLWMTQYFGTDKISPLHFQVFPNLNSHPPFSLPSPTFHPWVHNLPWLRFHSLKTKHEWGTMKEWVYRIVQPERPTSKLTTGCEGVTLASLFTLFFSLLFSPFLYCSLHTLGSTQRYVGMKRSTVHWPSYQQTSELTENCQKSLSPVKPRKIHIQIQELNWVVDISILTS